MAPRIAGRLRSFSEHGLYDGLFLMRDEESGTFWDHMTGEAVYGPLVGSNLEVETLRHTRAGQILGEDPDAMVALSDQAIREDDDLGLDGLLRGVRAGLGAFFSNTVEEEDDRRPTMDLGLGLWIGKDAVYYPYDTVIAEGNAILDRFGDRGVLVFLDPSAQVLGAFWTEAESFEWDDEVLRLSDGTFIEGGVFRDASGERVANNRPLQSFTRWYGFSLTFPGVPIYGGG